ncbi:hypothetical protein GGE45_003061 [Rhizobium aethiopicum]|uniref:Uncharacterized protein n=1 Tax=Rhizobium aethiopicum TaxID=1138170 RepID=A0A7W6MK14_9HYPH|nr:hypothetical protein [Rhizobium aethiopicum]MBB4580722.1 hypothetical protein [Rhizobium aethiopicum]
MPQPLRARRGYAGKAQESLTLRACESIDFSIFRFFDASQINDLALVKTTKILKIHRV